MMTEQQTPVMETAAPEARTTPPAVPPAAKPAGKKKKKKKGGPLKIVIIVAVIVAVLAVGGYLLWKFVFSETEEKGTAMTDFVRRDSIQSVVEGYGTTKAKDSATITPTAGGTVLEVYVKEGDQVTEGQQLYSMDDSTARQAVTDAQDAVVAAQKAVTNSQKELQAIFDRAKDLTITAPHAGKLMEVATFKVGDDVDTGTKIATLVNDTKLRLSLYYSYTYENQISVGQSVKINVPSIMGDLDGTVESINYVRRVVPEGAVTFEVIFSLKNPGTLTKDMEASVSMTGPDGNPIYPYEAGKLDYYETTQILAKAKGPAEAVHLINYGDVQAGQLLVQLGAEDNDEEIAIKENALKAAQDKLEECLKDLEDKQKELGDFNAVAPISGTVLSCNLVAGTKVESGQALTIADTSVMTVEISVDERNIQYVKAGMMVNIDQWGNFFMGIVESVSQTAKGENGVSAFPAVVKVDNPDGTLMTGMNVNYNFVASQSDNCLTVPVQAIMNVSFSGIDGAAGAEGDPGMMDPGMEGDPGVMDPGMEGDPDIIEPDLEGDPAVDDTLPPEDDEAVDGDASIGDSTIIDGDVSVGGGTIIDGGMVDVGGSVDVMPMPRSASGGYSVKPLMSFAVSRPMPGGGSVSMGGGMGATDDGTGTIVFVKAETAPENAILEPDPAWECPEGFFAVPVTVGLADNTKVEILSGLNEGDEIFIGYETQNANNWG